MKFIFKKRLKICTKEFIKVAKIVVITLIFVTGLILIKYKPLYKVEVDNIEIGYIKDKNEFNSLIKEYTENTENNVAFITLESEPKYKLELVSNEQETNEDEIFENIKENSVKTYTAYGITVNDDVKTYVETEEQAENVINSVKETLKEKNDININIKQIYTEENLEISESENAIEQVSEIANVQLKEQENNENDKNGEKKDVIAVVNEVALNTKPVSGTITSRFGESSSIRSSKHTGLDIAAPTGTEIKACSPGTVIFAETKGSYGKLVKIKHENGVETWYAHCSKIFVTSGQKVEAGEKIAAVGSTGNSTGSHLHFEIRINGTPVNPQKYIYKK